MLHPCKHIESAEYKNRDGSIVEPVPDADFYRREGAFILAECNDKILLVRPSLHNPTGIWELPGGGIDAGETPEQAAFRETIEETGLDLTGVALEKYFDHRVYLFLPQENHFWNYDQYYFSAILKDDMLFDGIKDAPEDGHIQWVSKEEIQKITIKHSVIPAIKAAGYL